MKKPLTEEIEKQFDERFSWIGDEMQNWFGDKSPKETVKSFLSDALSKQRKELLELVIESLPKEKEITVQADGQYHFVENTKVISYNTCLTEVKDLISKMTF